MKVSTWQTIAQRVAQAADAPEELVIHDRLLYVRHADWVVQGVLATELSYTAGPRLWRLTLPLFGVPRDFLTLDWCEQIRDFDGTREALLEVEIVATELIKTTGNENSALERIALDLNTRTAFTLEEQAYANLILGRMGDFRAKIESDDLLSAAKFASESRREKEAARFRRVKEMRQADAASARQLIIDWRNEFVRTLQTAGELGVIIPSRLPNIP